ncbi:MAG: hypothetical protein KIS94_09360 [Chitinophagales bacterium]|nr:hypothetical protein [Chitinophagales bacterium]
MKTLKCSFIKVAGLAAFMVLFGLAGEAFSQSTVSSKAVATARGAINRDLAKISQQQHKIEGLKAQCKSKQATATEKAAVRIELKKAQADLQHSKAYLAADKSALISEHNHVISEQKTTLREQRFKLAVTQANLFTDLIKGKETAVANAQRVVDGKREIRSQKAELQQAKVNRNNDLLAINQGIRDANAQSPIVLVAENTVAKTQNLVMK